MFEAAEAGNAIAKKEYKARLPALRTGLLEAQYALRGAEFPVLILFSGVDGAGKGDTLNILNQWMDPRYLRAFGFGPRGEEERARPEFWRFWRALPPRGGIGLYVGSWYSEPIAARVERAINAAEFDRRLARVRDFEKTLIEDGALLIKFWLHLSKKDQKRRLAALSADPDTAWRVTATDRHHLKLYDRFRAVAEQGLRATSTGEAPWIIVDGSDHRYRHLTVGEHILERLGTRLRKAPPPTPEDAPPPAPIVARSRQPLDRLDLSRRLTKPRYKAERKHWQSRLGRVARTAHARGISSVLVFEGWDASGKGGIIRRLVPALDARNYQVIPVAAPSDEERAHHYLWRFWRHIPRAGAITIYDRSWYGRVLVERVEGLARRQEWMRAYAEINDFEEQLSEAGILVVKYWVHIDPDEQLRRFRAREQTPWKRHKISDEDYRNREKWPAYEEAVADMIERTSTARAPWTLLEGNDKRYARIRALRTFCERLEAALEGQGRTSEQVGQQ